MTDPVKCLQCDALIKDMPKHLAKRHSGAPRPSLEANTAKPVQDDDDGPGFNVRIKVQDYTSTPGQPTALTRKTPPTVLFVGVDDKSNIAHFLAIPRHQAELMAQVDAKAFPTVTVKGYQFVRYDGARGSWHNATLDDNRKGR